MSALFSPYIWIILIGRMLSALLPVMWVLLVFSIKGIGLLKKNSCFRLVLVFGLVDIAVRFLLFFSGVPYQGRYFYPFVIICIFPAAAGFVWLLQWLLKFDKKPIWLTRKRIIIGLICLISLIHIGKALNPPSHKKWLDEIPEKIKDLCPKDKKPILISSIKDIRIAYYADAQWLKFVRPDIINYALNADIAVKSMSGEEIPRETGNSISEKTAIKVPKEAELFISLKNPYPFVKGTIKFEPLGIIQPEHLQIFTNFEKSHSTWNLIWEGNYTGKIRFLGKLGNTIKIISKSSQDWQFNNFSLVLDDKWQILKPGKGINSGYWFPAIPPNEIDNFGNQIKTLGGKNVFVLNNIKDEEFQKLFKKKNLEFPLKYVMEINDRKKDIYVLYQGRE